MLRKLSRRACHRWVWFVPGLLLVLIVWLSIRAPVDRNVALAQSSGDGPSGEEIFRFDTFGDEQFWTDELRMHRVIESRIDPLTALSLGLKVDVDALPDELIAAIENDGVDLTDPATTVVLIGLDAVVGVVGKVERIKGRDRLTEVGITWRCAIRRWMIHLCQASVVGWMGGPMSIWIRARLSRRRRRSAEEPRPFMNLGVLAFTIPDSISMVRVRHW